MRNFKGYVVLSEPSSGLVILGAGKTVEDALEDARQNTRTTSGLVQVFQVEEKLFKKIEKKGDDLSLAGEVYSAGEYMEEAKL